MVAKTVEDVRNVEGGTKRAWDVRGLARSASKSSEVDTVSRRREEERNPPGDVLVMSRKTGRRRDEVLNSEGDSKRVRMNPLQ
jgi:hypothetical protein